MIELPIYVMTSNIVMCLVKRADSLLAQNNSFAIQHSL